MEEKKNISRRDALKRMGASTLAVAVGTSGIAGMLESCTTKNAEEPAFANAVADEQQDLEFTRVSYRAVMSRFRFGIFTFLRTPRV